MFLPHGKLELLAMREKLETSTTRSLKQPKASQELISETVQPKWWLKWQHLFKTQKHPFARCLVVKRVPRTGFSLWNWKSPGNEVDSRRNWSFRNCKTGSKNSYIFCKILSFKTRLAQKVFNTSTLFPASSLYFEREDPGSEIVNISGSNSLEQLIILCPFNT